MDADNLPLRQLSELFRQDVFQGVPPADMSDAEVCACFLTWLGVYVDDPAVRRLLDEAPEHSARVKALEILAKMGGFLPDFHVHKHHHNAQPARPEQIGLTSQAVVDRLPLETRIQVLETIRQVRKEMEEKAMQPAVPKLTTSPETAAPGDGPYQAAADARDC
jgi:hypothetical protein